MARVVSVHPMAAKWSALVVRMSCIFTPYQDGKTDDCDADAGCGCQLRIRADDDSCE